MISSDFREIAHCGGYVRVYVRNLEGRLQGSLQVGGSSRNPMAWRGFHITPSGEPIRTARLGGIGDPLDVCEGALPFPAMFGSDSEGYFGHQCPLCSGYWRDASARDTVVCPYCGVHLQAHLTLTDAHRRYSRLFAGMVQEALSLVAEGQELEKEMSFDELADAAESEAPRPAFYYTEEAQQHQYDCQHCGSFNDVIGLVAYCSTCGARNDEHVLRERLSVVREALHSGSSTAEDVLRDTVSAFDGAVSHVVKQILQRIPMRPRRRSRFERVNHRLDALREALDQAIEVDIFNGLRETEIELAKRLFWRRHVHEHSAGIVDQEYVDNSGDSNVRPGQQLREDRAEVQELTIVVAKAFSTLCKGFAELFPPIDEPVRDFLARTASR